MPVVRIRMKERILYEREMCIAVEQYGMVLFVGVAQVPSLLCASMVRILERENPRIVLKTTS